MSPVNVVGILRALFSTMVIEQRQGEWIGQSRNMNHRLLSCYLTHEDSDNFRKDTMSGFTRQTAMEVYPADTTSPRVYGSWLMSMTPTPTHPEMEGMRSFAGNGSPSWSLSWGRGYWMRVVRTCPSISPRGKTWDGQGCGSTENNVNLRGQD